MYSHNKTTTLQTTFTEDSFARLASLKYGPSTPTVTTTPTYDTSSRLSSLKNDLAGGTTNDAIWTFGYSAAQQILTRTQTGSASYKYVAPANVGPNSYGINGLDQITAVNATSFTYDTKGNLTSDGVTTYSYNDYNMLTQAIKGTTTTNFTYDPSNRLASVAQGSSTTRFIYDGNDVIAEYNGSNVLQRRYVHGPGQDNPLLWYEGTDDTNLRFFTADQQGSVTATTSSAGTLRTIYTYDEYGKPLTATGSDVSRFRYTGQVYLPEVDLYNYKARLYDPKIGRFLQTDPIGYGDGLNWYAYVRNDPVNRTDWKGLGGEYGGNPGGCTQTGTFFHEVFDGVTGLLKPEQSYSSPIYGNCAGNSMTNDLDARARENASHARDLVKYIKSIVSTSPAIKKTFCASDFLAFSFAGGEGPVGVAGGIIDKFGHIYDSWGVGAAYQPV